jgi:hypothetical protein
MKHRPESTFSKRVMPGKYAIFTQRPVLEATPNFEKALITERSCIEKKYPLMYTLVTVELFIFILTGQERSSSLARQ